jgi:ferritin
MVEWFLDEKFIEVQIFLGLIKAIKLIKQNTNKFTFVLF